jgi:LPS O-antigen subunit length determinant protein (WzzB/FepE family)
MTEKETPLSSTPNQAQNVKHESQDEVNLLDLLEFLARKKVLIFFIASIFVVLSILYTLLTTPTYRGTIGFKAPKKSLTSIFPNFLHEVLPNASWTMDGQLAIDNSYILNEFMAEMQSYSNQEEVFIKGKFHERFVANNPEIVMKEEIVQEIYRSIRESATHARNIANAPKHKHVKEFLSAKVVNYEMKGVNPELASDFLNALADWVNNKVTHDLRESMEKGIKGKIDQLSDKLNSRVALEQLKYKNKVRVFTDNIEIAKNLGILGNNFDNFNPDGFVPDGFILKGRSKQIHFSGQVKAKISWPYWYLYGQRALEQELNLMKSRRASSEYAEESAELNLKIERLSKFDLSKINFEPVIISQPSIPPVNPITPTRMIIITIGSIFGLFFGILMVGLSAFLKTQLKNRSKLSPIDL